MIRGKARCLLSDQMSRMSKLLGALKELERWVPMIVSKLRNRCDVEERKKQKLSKRSQKVGIDLPQTRNSVEGPTS